MEADYNNSHSMIFLAGSSGSGKSTVGLLLAKNLDLPFYDLDQEIETSCGQSVADIFASRGEAAFRQEETRQLTKVIDLGKSVVALGGGALVDPTNRQRVEAAGKVLLLTASPSELVTRLQFQANTRPLLGNPAHMAANLNDLLERRQAHYASFPIHLDTSGLTPEETASKAQVLLGAFHIHGMGSGYDVRILPGGLKTIGSLFHERGYASRVVVISDETVAPLYADSVLNSLHSSGYAVHSILIPPGETSKTVQTVARLWDGFVEAGLERSSTVLALGGGVVCDLAGFAAATFLRGIRWVALPTTLLSMVDASLGGKTGADLPQGKNLVGAFYPPALVLADPDVLWTLPDAEIRSGLAEVLKHGILADKEIVERCGEGWDALTQSPSGHPDWTNIVSKAMAVKIRYIEADPYEKGQRAALNLGHTIGHAIERASNYTIRHGEAVGIGMVIEARLAERLGLAQLGLSNQIASVLLGLGLPTELPKGLHLRDLAQWMSVDKKREGGTVHFALPKAIGDVRTGISVDPTVFIEMERGLE